MVVDKKLPYPTARLQAVKKMEIDKAQINALVKQIKAAREKKPDAPKEKTDKKVDFQISSKPEKLMIGMGFAAGLAIIFDDSRKRRKNPAKARCFVKRCFDNYKKIDKLLDSTVAKNLKKKPERLFSDEKLEHMTIEKAIEFDV
jgi:hypothetical protein